MIPANILEWKNWAFDEIARPATQWKKPLVGHGGLFIA